jgi:hypothetical protein
MTSSIQLYVSDGYFTRYDFYVNSIQQHGAKMIVSCEINHNSRTKRSIFFVIIALEIPDDVDVNPIFNC